MRSLTDKSSMPFGKHKGARMKDVPPDYLLWLYETVEDDESEDINDNTEAVLDYIEDNLEEIEKENENDS